MRIVVVLIILLAGCESSRALADDESFDVPNGQFSTKYSGALVPGTLVSCEFSIDEALFGSRWAPMVSILFEVDGETADWATSFKLSASRREDEEGWRYFLDVSHGDDRESTILMHTGTSELVLPLKMWWTDEQAVVVSVGDDPIHMSLFDVLNHSFLKWDVNLSGVRGSGDCDSRILGDDDED